MKRIFGALFLIGCGAAFLAVSAYMLSTGGLRYGSYRTPTESIYVTRHTHPITYWSMFTLSSLIGVTAVARGIIELKTER